jgi:cobalt-zinc-cadmium efflux system outer membrane protein
MRFYPVYPLKVAEPLGKNLKLKNQQKRIGADENSARFSSDLSFRARKRKINGPRPGLNRRPFNLVSPNSFKLVFFIIFFICFIFPWSGYSSTPPGVPVASTEKVLTLEEALDLALRANPDILQAQQEIQLWQGQALQLTSWPLPEIAFSREGLNLGRKKGESEINFGLQQLIEFPEKRSLRRQSSQSGIEAASWRLEARKKIVLSQVKKAYYLVGQAQEILAYYRSLLDFFNESLRTAQLRYEAGEVPYLDIVRLELEKLRLRNEILQAEKDLEERWLDLNLLLGGEIGERREVEVKLKFEPLARSLEEILEEVSRRPSLISLSQEVERTRAEVKLARKSLLPDIQIAFYYPSLRTSSIGFQIGTSLPLWRSQQKGAVAQAMAQQRLAEIALEFERRQIISGVISLFNRIRSLEKRLELFEQSLLEETRSLLHLTISLYAQGKAGFLDLLDVYRLNRETYLAFLKTLFEHYLALAELEVAGESN